MSRKLINTESIPKQCLPLLIIKLSYKGWLRHLECFCSIYRKTVDRKTSCFNGQLRRNGWLHATKIHVITKRAFLLWVLAMPLAQLWYIKANLSQKHMKVRLCQSYSVLYLKLQTHPDTTTGSQRKKKKKNWWIVNEIKISTEPSLIICLIWLKVFFN